MGLEPGDTKEQPLRAAVAILEATRTPYALIGGLAVQLHSREPRTTLDIDFAVRRFAEVPKVALEQAGFVHEGRHKHSDNWRAPGAEPPSQRIAVQFSAEEAGLDAAIAGAQVMDVGGYSLRLVGAADLVALKLTAAEDPTRRPSKRRQDLLDVVMLAEAYPREVADVRELEERVAALSQDLLTLGRDRRGSRPER